MVNQWHRSAATVALCVTTTVAAQNAGERKEIINATQAAELARQGAELQAKFEREEARVLLYLIKYPQQLRSFERNGSTYYLARLDADGNPVYVKTKGGHGPNSQPLAQSGESGSLHGGGSR
jgi:hypothetical protein